MKVDNVFDKTELLQHLSTAYGLPLQSITFFPEGEDSYGYITGSETGEKYFVKASTSVQIPACKLHHFYGTNATYLALLPLWKRGTAC